MKDYSLLEKWVSEIELSDIDVVLSLAKKLTEAINGTPDALTLGFSPQILVGIVALNDGNVTVISSPEVIKGLIPPARFSYRILSYIKEHFDIKIKEASFAPNNSISVEDIVKNLTNIFSSLNIQMLDISGGTQLVPIAAIKAKIKKISYSYPDGEKLKIFSFELE